MVVCIVGYVGLVILFFYLLKKGRLQEYKRMVWILCLSNTVAMTLFVWELFQNNDASRILRNSYGEGSRIAEYEVTIEGELEKESLAIEIQEQAYTKEEIQAIFDEMKKELDEVILGDNASRDRVEHDLNLVETLSDYPVDIRWELDSYEVMDAEGRIIKEAASEEGTLLEVRGILTYGQEEAVYVTHVMVYPETKTGKEKWLDAVKKSIEEAEGSTREQEAFSLPESIDGKEVQWSLKPDTRGYAVLGFGFLFCIVLHWKKKQDEKEQLQKRREQMIRDYPDILSKFTLLLSTGMTVKNVWTRITKLYEEQKELLGERAIYEEMCITFREMQGGIAEAEAYERFGKRCGIAVYMKFGALLSQNLRKGSKGLVDLLQVESIQAFENRKSTAKRLGEEAGTKLLLPMFGMLAVVMVIVIIPAFLSIQL